MSWAEPSWAWLMGVVAALGALAVWNHQRHLRQLGRLFGATLLDRVLPPATRLRRQARDALAVTGRPLLHGRDTDAALRLGFAEGAWTKEGREQGHNQDRSCWASRDVEAARDRHRVARNCSFPEDVCFRQR